MVEVVGLCAGIATAAGGPTHVWMAQALSYGLVGLMAYLLMASFLDRRGVPESAIWNWKDPRWNAKPEIPWPHLVNMTVLGGLGIGASSLLYLRVLEMIPWTQEMLEATKETLARHPSAIWWHGIMAVAMAPLAEEYFFRGLLFRALDREWDGWGGWKAIVGSSAFFAIYHPPISWLPVFAMGCASAWLFRRGGRLWACVLLHMTYNLVVVVGGG